jgi:integrase
MSRQVGTIKKKGNRWVASVPIRRGAKAQKTATFATEALAREWLRLCNIALDAGEVLPDPDIVRKSNQALAHDGITLAELFEWYIERFYDSDAASSISSRQQLKNHWAYVLDFFGERKIVSTITVDQAQDFARSLVGTFRPGEPPVDAPTVTDAGEVTVAEAVTITGKSKATINRMRGRGAFPNLREVQRNGRLVAVIPVADLVANGLLTPASKRRRKTVSKAYAQDILSSFRKVLQAGIEDGRLVRNPAAVVHVPNVFDEEVGPQKPEPTIFPIHRLAAVLQHLHVHFQLVFLIQLMCGLRVSEVFGLRLSALEEAGGTLVIHVREQGGKQFKVRDPQGRIATVPNRKRVKSRASRRIVGVPPMLAELVRHYMTAYHFDDTGQADPDARLICGLRSPGVAGVGAYQAAVSAAFRKAGFTTEAMGFRVSCHWLRKSFGGILKELQVDEGVRTRVLGHRLRAKGDAAEITVHSYTPHSATYEQVITAARRMAEYFQAHGINSVFFPTDRRPQVPKTNATQQALEIRAEELWAAVGVYRTATDGDSAALVTLAEAAAIAGTTPQTLRRWAREGALTTTTKRDGHGIRTRYVRVDDVLAAKARQGQGEAALKEIARRTGITYRALLARVRSGQIRSVKDPFTGRIFIPEDVVEELLAESRRLVQLHREAMTMREASRLLGLAPRTVNALLHAGKLHRHPETDGRGSIYVTRDSVERYRAERSMKQEVIPPSLRRANSPVGWMPLREASNMLGLGPREITSLAGRGVFTVEQVRNTVYVKASDVAAFLVDQRRVQAPVDLTANEPRG